MDANKRFAKLAGTLPVIDLQGNVLQRGQYPDFTDAREVLRVMMERGDWDEFVEFIYHKQPADIQRLSPYAELVFNYILDTTGKLRDLAIEWMEERHE